MTDIFTKKKRSEIMSRVRSRNTDIEILLRKALFAKGYRFRIHYPIIGKPDIVFPTQKVAIFCDGDFWHGRYYKKESKNYNEFWEKKIKGNIERDKKVKQILKKQGWKVIRFWKSEIKKDIDKCLEKISTLLE